MALPFGSRVVTAALVVFSLCGCSQRYVEFTVRNDTSAQMRTVEVDYPGGSFGTTKLAPGQVFHYHFKALRAGSLVLLYDDSRIAKRSEGPPIRQSQGGTIEVTISNSGVAWKNAYE